MTDLAAEAVWVIAIVAAIFGVLGALAWVDDMIERRAGRGRDHGNDE